ncbi:MAG TPA: aldo/keto reductase [Gemmatimonadaceae bacterium]|nr:aldo/keto reductase [Gemmatimonadaceae bacterium]
MSDPLVARRALGRTGFMASVLGIGDLADRGVPLERCAATIRRAVDAGLNVIDTAPNYEDGYSERVVGHALRGIRDRMFVISKIDELTQAVAPQIEASLARLEMDSTDAFVFHNLSDLDVLHESLRPGGGFEQLSECMQRGLTRFRGISSHNPDVLRAALDAGVCDVVMFPVGPFVDERYVTEILPMARRLGVATICFKTFGAGKLLGDVSGYNQPLQLRPRGKLSSGGIEGVQTVLPRLSVAECVHYTLALNPDVALLGLSFPNEQDQAFAAARSFRPLSDEAMEDVRHRAIEARRDKGPCWWNPDPQL